MNTPTPDDKSLEPREVPEELMQRLHEATQKLSDARALLEQTLDSPEGDLEHRQIAAARLREAERDVEQATEEVNRFLAS